MKISNLPLIIFFIVLLSDINAQETNKKISGLRDSSDHAIDISDMLIQKKGVLILPVIITEPSVGYGLSVAAVYFQSSYSEKKGPPSMSGVLGAGTENGTWAAGAFHKFIAMGCIGSNG
jgi:hypothetical protein